MVQTRDQLEAQLKELATTIFRAAKVEIPSPGTAEFKVLDKGVMLAVEVVDKLERIATALERIADNTAPVTMEKEIERNPIRG